MKQSDMQVRFKRAFEILESNYQYVKDQCEDDAKSMLEGNVCLMWLRNRAELWSDWEEDESWVINGVDYNPNHPDNLSDSVYKLWLKTKKGFQITVKV